MWERDRTALIALVTALAAALIEQRITVAEWQAAMRQLILRSHTLAYAVGRGGLQLLTPADVQRIEARAAGQFSFLGQWASGITLAAGLDAALTAAGNAVSLRQFQARASMYIEAALASLSEGKSVALGLPSLPAYAGDGTTRCLVNCHCAWRIKLLSEGNADCYWLLGAAEHCEHCPRRALAWSPIRIRNGELLPYVRVGLFL